MIPRESRIRLLRERGISRDTEAEECVAWAANMLKLGRDTESVRILSSLAPLFTYDEVARYLGLALEELNIPRVSEQDAVFAYAADELNTMLQGESTEKATLHTLYQVCVEYNCPKPLFPFYLLHFSLTDLDNSGQQHYWPGANRENIHTIIRTAADQYLAAFRRDAAEPRVPPDAPQAARR